MYADGKKNCHFVIVQLVTETWKCHCLLVEHVYSSRRSTKSQEWWGGRAGKEQRVQIGEWTR